MKKIFLGLMLISSMAIAKPIKTIDQAEKYYIGLLLGTNNVLTNDRIMGKVLKSSTLGNIDTNLAVQSLKLMCKQQGQTLIDIKVYDTGLVRALTKFNNRVNGFVGYQFYEVDTKKGTMDSSVYIDVQSK